MLTGINDLNKTVANAAGTAGKATQSTADAQSDRFLKLLVAQLNNQDPMNPMDNAQMTSQMAQINTVTGITQLNDTVKTLASQFNAMQVLQGSALVGREVLTTGRNITINEGVGRAAFDLADEADKVTVQVLSPGGQVLDTLSFGAQTSGRHYFGWDASKYTGTGSPVFNVVASQGTAAVKATPLIRDTVVSIGNDAGTMSVTLKGGTTVAHDAVKTIL